MKTVAECNAKAIEMMDGYKYLYGAKGQLYTSKLVESLAKQYPSKFTAALKKEALKDADKGYKAGDCSYFVCSVLGISQVGSTAIKNKAVQLLKINKADAKPGMAIWKSGHIGYIGDDLKIYEFRNTTRDTCVSSWDARAKDFTYMFVVKGSPLYTLLYEIPTAVEVVTYYPIYTGKSTSITTALASVGEKNTSMAHRKKIALKNGYTSYTGTSKQNLDLVAKLKAGKLIKA